MSVVGAAGEERKRIRGKWEAVNETNIATFQAGDWNAMRPLLRRLFNGLVAKL